ncbi:MAG: polysaccharide deacetylase family protein [Bacillota bacterium]|nr:polysaccharide deacetylase family protein [Bacillota bacterium]
MLSYNNKKLLFKPAGSKKYIIATVAVSVLLSFSAGAAIYFNAKPHANQNNTAAYSNISAGNAGNKTDGPTGSGPNMDKPLGGSTKDSGNTTTAEPAESTDPAKPAEPILKDYEVKIEDIFKKDGIKNAFLTFDDGPTKNITPQVLDILNRYNIKASFFVLGNMAEKSPDMLKREYAEGNSINMHSYSHDYNTIYSSSDAFKSDFDQNIAVMKNILGQDFNTRIYRFPGGSSGKTREPYRQELMSFGYHYIDWNALTGDAELIKENGKSRTRTAPELLVRLKESIAGSGNPEDIVVLMHDAGSKQATVDILPQVIEYLKAQGYNFKTMR